MAEKTYLETLESALIYIYMNIYTWALSKIYFLKTVTFRFVEKLSLEFTITKSVETIYKLKIKKKRINAIVV